MTAGAATTWEGRTDAETAAAADEPDDEGEDEDADECTGFLFLPEVLVLKVVVVVGGSE